MQVCASDLKATISQNYVRNISELTNEGRILMTIKAFAEKYNLSYSKAYEASYGLFPERNDTGLLDFHEADLYSNLVKILNSKRTRQINAAKDVTKELCRIRKIAKR